MVSIGERLKKLRTERGLSQDDLAEKSGITKNSISEIERGKRGTVTLETVAILAKALGVKPYRLMGDDPDPVTTEDLIEFIKTSTKLTSEELEMLDQFRSFSRDRKLYWLYLITLNEKYLIELKAMKSQSASQALKALEIVRRK